MSTVSIAFEDRKKVIECIKKLMARYAATEKRHHDEYLERYAASSWFAKKFLMPVPGPDQSSPESPAYAFSPIRSLEPILETLECPYWHTVTINNHTFNEIMSVEDVA
jgi:hypothetical protein